LERGDEVGSLIETYMDRSPAPNSHNSGANQSDSSLGYTAAITEGLLQIRLKPVLFLPAVLIILCALPPSEMVPDFCPNVLVFNPPINYWKT